jgi:O-palmitoleoyl-L-serine hydrolase
MARLTALLLAAIATASAEPFSLTLLDSNTYPMATCLDGSQGGFYLSPGSGSGSQTWLIHTQGGGWCSSLADCATRASGVNPFGPSLPSLGGSGQWPTVADCTGPSPANAPVCVTDGGANGLLSENSTVNPLFHNANRVFVNYCDGGSFAGSVDEAVAVNASTKVYFRGRYILDAVLDELAPLLAASNATEVILKGCSAGGLAQYMHADDIVERLQPAVPNARFVSAPGAGFFMDLPTLNGGTYVFREMMQWVYTAQNASLNLDADCVAYYAALSNATGQDEGWHCFMAPYLLPFVTTPLFVSNFLADITQQMGILDLGCSPTVPAGQPGACNSTQIDALNGLRLSMISALAPVLSSTRNGAFLAECSVHVIEDDDGAWQGIEVQGQTQAETFAAWWKGGDGMTLSHVVDGAWGTNPTCGRYT